MDDAPAAKTRLPPLQHHHKLWGMLAIGVILGVGLIWAFQTASGTGFTGSFSGIDALPEGETAAAAPGSPAAAAVVSKGSEAGTILPVVLQLRKFHVSGDLVSGAQKVTQLETLVRSSGNEALNSAWGALALCVARRCDDAGFLAFIRVLAHEDARSQKAPGAFIVNLLQAREYWGSDNTVKFSEAVTAVDAEVQRRGGALLNQWKSIVACAGKCSDADARYFGLLESLAGN